MSEQKPKQGEVTSEPISPHPPPVDGVQAPMPPHEDEYDLEDETVAESFPASDPPPGPASIGR